MKKDFKFSYSAPSQNERQMIDCIRQQYMPKTETEIKIEKLKKLNGKVTNTPKIIALMLGIVGTLVFGLGLSMILEWSIFLWGIVVGSLGILLFSLAFPFYKLSLKRLKEKYKNQILELSSEILNAEDNM